MSEAILYRRSDKPNATTPIFSDVGSEIQTKVTPLTPDSKLPRGTAILLAQGWEINLIEVSGGYFLHHPASEARTSGVWGVYAAVTPEVRLTGGIREQGDLYSLYDNGKIKPNSLIRKTGPQTPDDEVADYLRNNNFPDNYGGLLDEDYKYKVFQKMMGDGKVWDFVTSKLKRKDILVSTTFHPWIRVEQNTEAGKTRQLVTLCYLRASNHAVLYKSLEIQPEK